MAWRGNKQVDNLSNPHSNQRSLPTCNHTTHLGDRERPIERGKGSIYLQVLEESQGTGSRLDWTPYAGPRSAVLHSALCALRSAPATLPTLPPASSRCNSASHIPLSHKEAILLPTQYILSEGAIWLPPSRHSHSLPRNPARSS